MADVSKLKLKEVVYNFKDAQARESIENLPVPMQFKGTLGTDGTTEELPEASLDIIGWTYKVVTEDTYKCGTYKYEAAVPDDLFICNASLAWVHVKSGDQGWQKKLTQESNAGNGIKIDNDTQKISLLNAVDTKLKACIVTGDGTTTTYKVEHNFGTKDVFIQVYAMATGESIVTDMARDSLDSCSITFKTAPGSGENYRVMLLAFESTTEETAITRSLPALLGLDLTDNELL